LRGPRDRVGDAILLFPNTHLVRRVVVLVGRIQCVLQRDVQDLGGILQVGVAMGLERGLHGPDRYRQDVRAERFVR
jgi:hypothetical protein